MSKNTKELLSNFNISEFHARSDDMRWDRYKDEAAPGVVYHGINIPGSSISASNWFIWREITYHGVSYLEHPTDGDKFGYRWDIRTTYFAAIPAIIPTYNPSNDSFGRLRVSSIHNIFESQHANSEQDEFWDTSLRGGGTKTYTKAKAQVELGVGTSIGDRVIRQTFNRFHYAAGQSLLIRLTGIIGSGKAGVNSCLGYYDNNNGLIFRVSDGVFQVGVRSSTTGSVVEEWVNQANFNGDPLDGTGQSGLVIDLDTTHIFEINFQWLGVGSVHFIIVVNGSPIVLHSFHHANTYTEVYMSTPHLPLRYEIMNTAATVSGTELFQLCSQIGNEGESITGDLLNTVHNGTNVIQVNAITYKPIISMRHKSGSGIVTQLEEIQSLLRTQDDVHLLLIVDAQLIGDSWTDYSQFIERDVSATAYTGGTEIASIFVGRQSRISESILRSKFRLGEYIDGTPQTYTIVGKSFITNADIGVSFGFRELF